MGIDIEESIKENATANGTVNALARDGITYRVFVDGAQVYIEKAKEGLEPARIGLYDTQHASVIYH